MVTVEELQALLDSDEDSLEVEIHSDGSVHAVPKGTAKNESIDKSKMLSLQDLADLKDDY
jgi:hypothetical protein